MFNNILEPNVLNDTRIVQIAADSSYKKVTSSIVNMILIKFDVIQFKFRHL